MAVQPDKNNQLVVSVFDNIMKAKQAQKDIELWDEAQAAVKLGGSAIIYKDTVDGKIKHEQSAKFDWKKGALIGLLLVPLTGGLLLPVFGAAAGLATTWLKGIKREDIDKIASQVNAGKAALAVLCDEYEMPMVSAELTRLGGTTITGYKIPDKTAVDVQNAVQSAADKGQIGSHGSVS